MRRIENALRGGIVVLSVLSGLTAALAHDEIKQFEDTSRLVSIGGSLTEIVYELGEGDKLVARDSTAVFPPEAFALPDVGYMRALAPEGVLSVNPSALLVIEGSGPEEVLEVLEQSGVPYETVHETHSGAGILEKVRAVGVALGAQEKAEQLAKRIEADLAATKALRDRITAPKSVLFILSTTGDRLMVSGVETAADSVINMAGAINAVTAFTGYKALTHEAIIEAKPDVILMMDRAGNGDHAAIDAQLWADPAIAMTPAGESKSVIRMDGAYLLGFGPRTAAAVGDLARALYPDELKPE